MRNIHYYLDKVLSEIGELKFQIEELENENKELVDENDKLEIENEELEIILESYRDGGYWKLQWTDAEKLSLPEIYTELMVHVALEKADNDKDEKNFYAILNGDGDYRTIMLKNHIQKTLGVFTWNFTA